MRVCISILTTFFLALTFALLTRYIGEVISDFEADQREDDSYLFDLDDSKVNVLVLTL